MDKRKSSSAVTLDLLISFWQKRQIMHSLSRMICRRSCGVLSSKAISLWDEIQIAIKCDVNMFHILLISFFSSSEPKYLSRKVSICLTVILGNNRMLFALYSQKFLRKKFCEKKFIFRRYSAGDYIWAANAFFRNVKKILRNAFVTQI